MSKFYAPAIAMALLIGPAAAQTQNQPGAAPATQAQPTQAPRAGTAQNQGSTAALNFITARDANTWMASELIGKDVYGSNNEDIGEVGDVLLNRNGQVIGVVLDVGGFLGLGETNVAVPLTALQFTDGDGQTTANRATNTTGTAANTNSTDNKAASQQPGPDRIVLIVTKEQLQAAPRFDDKQNAGMNNNNAPATGNAPRR